MRRWFVALVFVWRATCDSDAMKVFIIMTEMADALACSRDVDRLDRLRLLRWGSSITCLGFGLCRMSPIGSSSLIESMWRVCTIAAWCAHCFVWGHGVFVSCLSQTEFDLTLDSVEQGLLRWGILNAVLDFQLCRGLSFDFGRMLCADCNTHESLCRQLLCFAWELGNLFCPLWIEFDRLLDLTEEGSWVLRWDGTTWMLFLTWCRL